VRWPQWLILAIVIVAIVVATLGTRSRPHSPPSRVTIGVGGKCAQHRSDVGAPVACPYGRSGANPRSDPAERIARATKCVSGGEVLLTSGRVVATDPLVFTRMRPFTRTVAPGRYAVILAREGSDNAFAILKIGDARPVRYELALLPGEVARPDAKFAYPVDSGTGGYMDADVARLIVDDEGLLDLLYAHGYHDNPWANVCVDPDTGGNLAAFTSGAGDGSYPVWIGFAADGTLVAFITDFGIDSAEGD
jgi:hypothetical protein